MRRASRTDAKLSTSSIRRRDFEKASKLFPHSMTNTKPSPAVQLWPSVTYVVHNPALHRLLTLHLPSVGYCCTYTSSLDRLRAVNKL